MGDQRFQLAFKYTASTWMNDRAQNDDVTFLVMRVKEG